MSPSEPDRIIYLVPGFPADEHDTACVPAVQAAIAGVAAAFPGVDVQVIAFHYPFTRATYHWHGLTVHALGGRNRGKARRLPMWTAALRRLWSLSRSAKAPVLHTFWLGECTWLAQRLGPPGLPHVASVAGRDALPANRYLPFIDLGRCVVTAGSEFAADTLARTTGRSADVVVPLGLDHFPRGGKQSTRRDIDVLGAGSFIPEKAFEAFVEIIASLRAERPELRAVLFGDGPGRDRLERAAAAAGLSGILRFAGHRPRHEVLGAMRRARVFLHPARYEAQGYVFLEALAAGAHVVCRDVGFTGPSPHVHRCADDAGLRETTASLLDAPLDHRHVAVPTARDTARAFAEIYGLRQTDFRRIIRTS